MRGRCYVHIRTSLLVKKGRRLLCTPAKQDGYLYFNTATFGFAMAPSSPNKPRSPSTLEELTSPSNTNIAILTLSAPLRHPTLQFADNQVLRIQYISLSTQIYHIYRTDSRKKYLRLYYLSRTSMSISDSFRRTKKPGQWSQWF